MNHNILKGRKLFVPEMDYGGARVLAASYRSLGIDASVVPPSTKESMKKGFACTSGEECFPQQITVGDFLEILDSGTVKARDAAFFMPTATGPCRFGQYATLIRQIFRQRGYGDAYVYSLASEDGYASIGGASFIKRVWWGVVASDQLRRACHRIRPYEKTAGTTDAVYCEGVRALEKLTETDRKVDGRYFIELVHLLEKSKADFESIEKYDLELPLIGVVGEIFCRLNNFSNSDLIRRMEKMGAEAWLAGVAEWILYTNFGETTRLAEEGKRFSGKMLKAVIKNKLMKKYEHRLSAVFSGLLKGREDETNIEKLLKYSDPYLPSAGAPGEMTLNTANAIHMYYRGVDGVIDISPFTCMNGIVSEAVYPVISRDHNNIPIRVFYFDGTETDLDRDLGIFLELARNYRAKRLSR